MMTMQMPKQTLLMIELLSPHSLPRTAFVIEQSRKRSDSFGEALRPRKRMRKPNTRERDDLRHSANMNGTSDDDENVISG